MPFFLAPFIVNALISVALSVAATLVQQIFKQDQKQTKAGVRGSIQTGGDNPLAFIMGRYATGGQLEYAGTWGNDGDTPNAFYTKVISVSDLPVRGLAGLFVGSERVTILGGGGAIGAPVEQYRVDGKDHLWIKFYDGNQTVADPFLLEKFGADPDRPYLADMIGRGVAYVIITALVNRELFSGLPEYMIEVDGIPLNDRRGGTAQHDNPMVGIDTLLGGLSYGGQWVYGPQSITAARRPLATWQPQMNKCDAIVDGEKAFRFGYEVTVDQEPHAVIGELLKACEGRIAEIGGIYKPLVGGPDAPVVSFTDEDIVITEGQTLDPFPGLEATFNGITATYPEPAEAWQNKEAPPRYRSDLEALDDNRRLPFSTSYAAVPYALQVQRLMRAAIEETRRFRRHVQTMPPEWWEYEPLDAALWTSERNGYTNKLFLITAQDDLPNGNQVPALQEQDAADYGWQSSYVLPWDVVPLVIARPAPQVTTGFFAAPYVVVDATGNQRRPAVEVFWDSGLHDVRAVRIQVREGWGSKNVIADATIEYDIDAAAPSAVISNAAILPSAVYEVRALYLPFSGRVTRWSNQDQDGMEGAWPTVTTPDVYTGPADLTPELVDLFTGMQEFMNEELPSVRGELDDIRAQLAEVTGAADWDAGVAYQAGALVKYDGALYRASSAPPAGTVPTNTQFWEKIGDYASIGEAVAALAARINEAETKITANEQGIVSTTRDTRRIQNALMAAALLGAEQGGNQVIENKDQLAATATISETVRTEVSRIEGTTTALAEQIDVVQAKVEEDVAEAISAVTTQVQDVDGRVTAQAERIDQLRVVVGDSGAEVLVKGEVVSGPGGPGSRYAIRLQTTSNGEVLGQGVFFVDVLPNGESTIGLSASKTVIYAADGTPIALFTGDGFLRSSNGAFLLNLFNGDVTMTRGSVRSADGKFELSPSLKRLVITS